MKDPKKSFRAGLPPSLPPPPLASVFVMGLGPTLLAAAAALNPDPEAAAVPPICAPAVVPAAAARLPY